MHEALRKGGGEPILYHEKIALSIRHVGYSSGRIRAKHERNLALMERRMEETGLLPGDCRYLADTYYGLGKYAAALLYARAALEENVTSIGAQSHLHHLLLDAMEKEHCPLAEQIAAARQARDAFPQLPDFHGRLGLLRAAAGDGAALSALTEALRRSEQHADADGEASAFSAWAGAVSAARARLLMEAGERSAAEEELARALVLDTAREEALDVFVELHGQNLDALRELCGTDAATLSYLARFADSYGWLALAEAARAALSAMTGKASPAPEIYARLQELSPADAGRLLVSMLAECVREMPEILLRLERESRAESPPLYARLRDLLPEAMRAFWRHYDEPDAVSLPESMEGYNLVREAFIHHADAAQAERFLRAAAGYGAPVLRAAAEAFAAAQRWAAAYMAWAFVAAVEGVSADSLYGQALAALHMGSRDEAETYLKEALCSDAGHMKAKELMELIR